MLGILDTDAKFRRCLAFEASQKAAHEAVRKAGVARLGCCSACGLCTTATRLHHPSYNAPLEVVELCPGCHDEEHRKLGWGAGDELPDGWQVDGAHWTPPPNVPSLAECGMEDLDFAMFDPPETEAKPEAHATPWHARRSLSFGASDVPALLVGLGLRDAADAPSYMRPNAAKCRVKVGDSWVHVPRIVAQKAGRKGQLSVGDAARIGLEREAELLAKWGARRHDLDPSTLRPVAERECLPLVDRHCPRLSASPDHGVRDLFGSLVNVQAKCTRFIRDDLPWYWRDQVQAEMAVMGDEVERTLVVIGQGWARREDFGIHVHEVRRDESAIELIRSAVLKGWSLVEQVR